MTKAVEIKNLNFAYPGGVSALKNINLEIEAGETFALVGANGAGKSTLLLHLNGLLGGGEDVKIFSKLVDKDSLAFVRKEAGLLFQDSKDQLFMPTVIEDVMFGPRNLGLPEAAALEVSLKALKTAGVAHKKNYFPHHLSLGEQKRAALAGVLAMSPGLLVLDEPTSGLDPRGRKNLIALLKGLKCTKVIATHDLDMVLETADRVAVMNEGFIIRTGKPAEIFSDAAFLEAHGLEKPLSLKK